MTQALGGRGKQGSVRRGKERERSSLSCSTEYDDGTVLSFRVVGECLSPYIFPIVLSVCVCVCTRLLLYLFAEPPQYMERHQSGLSLSMKC